jgi:diguanylate cyclase (GGDEF)-like protein
MRGPSGSQVDLSHVTTGAAGRPAAPVVSRSLTAFVLLVSSVGAVAAGLVWAHQPPWSGWGSGALVLVLVAVSLVLGELRPIPISRGDDSTDQITISTTSALMLVIVGPLGFALLVQCAAVLIDDLRARRSPLKVVFNFSQYVLTLVAARVVFCALAHEPLLAPYHLFGTEDLGAALAAGVTFFAVNLLLISAVVAVATRQRLVDLLKSDLRFQATTSGVLVALAPVGVVAVQTSPWLLPLLTTPLLAVHHSARLAIKHERESLHDPLSGLANRQLFRDRAARVVAEAARTGTTAAVMIIDLDHFKEINDTLGHQVGDELLVEVARRLEQSLPEQATVARLGGDEFAVLVADVGGREEAEAIAGSMLRALTSAFIVGDIRLSVQASAGIALAPRHGSDVFTIMKRADVAMYDAKGERARVRTYRPETDTHTPRRLELLSDLRTAGERGELFLVYQPKVDLGTDRVTGVEALVRWSHPTRGLVLPDEFVSLAENTGIVGLITAYVLDAALDQVCQWSADGIDLDVAVNISVRDLGDASLPQAVAGALERWSVEPGRLTLEVTESGVMTDPHLAIEVLESLRGIGVRLAVDDFGTGNASLTYLKQLAIDELKIDRSFITHYADDPNDEIIVRSTVDLAHRLGLWVVAEGVEDQGTLEDLRRIGCDTAQGYHLSRPMTARELERWVRVRTRQRLDGGVAVHLAPYLAFESA